MRGENDQLTSLLREHETLLRLGLATLWIALIVPGIQTVFAPWSPLLLGLSAAHLLTGRALRLTLVAGSVASWGVWAMTPISVAAALFCAVLVARINSGAGGAWLLELRHLARRRRSALFAWGLLAGSGASVTLAGDLYEEAGLAGRALSQRGGSDRGVALYASFVRALGRVISLIPGGAAFCLRRALRTASELALSAGELSEELR